VQLRRQQRRDDAQAWIATLLGITGASAVFIERTRRLRRQKKEEIHRLCVALEVHIQELRTSASTPRDVSEVLQKIQNEITSFHESTAREEAQKQLDKIAIDLKTIQSRTSRGESVEFSAIEDEVTQLKKSVGKL
jgi:phenylalanyl-tRNA synthetase alpha subunit